MKCNITSSKWSNVELAFRFSYIPSVPQIIRIVQNANNRVIAIVDAAAMTTRLLIKPMRHAQLSVRLKNVYFDIGAHELEYAFPK